MPTARTLSNPNRKIEKYGTLVPAIHDPVELEMEMIRGGGRWQKKDGGWVGEGLFFHYKRLQQLLWPMDDNHRWSDLILQEILNNHITVLAGCKDSGKTHTCAKFALTDYWCFPQTTLILISSTELRGADYRVWGDLKNLFRQARDLRPDLIGKVLESKHAICTDDLKDDDVRDPRKGIVFIPCFGSGGQWQGIKSYAGIKQKRRVMIGDECFPAGTLVDTPTGQRRIETLKSGDAVINAIGIDRILGVRRSMAKRLCRIVTTDGRRFECTPNHEILTQHGWTKAVDINRQHYILSTYEAMRILRETVPSKSQEQSVPAMPGKTIQGCLPPLRKTVQKAAPEWDGEFLQSELFNEMEIPTARVSREVLHRGTRKENFRCEAEVESGAPRIWGYDLQNDENKQSDARSSTEVHWKPNNFRQNQSDNGTRRKGVDEVVEIGVPEMELPNSDEYAFGKRTPNKLQRGRNASSFTPDNRGRWKESFQPTSESQILQEGQLSHGSWVESCEIYEPTNTEASGSGRNGVEVFNLHVEKLHAYSVNGLCKKNCQFMKSPYVEVPSAMSKTDRCVFLGNPIGEGDPLDRFSEPVNGWGTEGVIDKTTVYESKFGRVVNLVGTDSPNYDYSPDEPVKYPYLMNRVEERRVKDMYGSDSSRFWSLVKGVRRTGLVARRVLTMAMCEQFGAFAPVAWLGEELTWIYAVDAAYGGIGGDRCVGLAIRFGKEVNGKIVIQVFPPSIIPVSVQKKELPEDQIAMFVKAECERLGIPPENMFFDARATLAVSLGRIWSANVNAVEFGGSPTKRPVTMDSYILDKDTKQRRLKRCDEEYSKFVTELWFSARYAVEAGQVRELPREIAEEGCSREWKTVRGDRIEVETKEDMKERTNKSPDYFDSFVIACEGARRKGFQIARLASTEQDIKDVTWKRDLRDRMRELKSHYSLRPSNH